MFEYSEEKDSLVIQLILRMFPNRGRKTTSAAYVGKSTRTILRYLADNVAHRAVKAQEKNQQFALQSIHLINC